MKSSLTSVRRVGLAKATSREIVFWEDLLIYRLRRLILGKLENDWLNRATPNMFRVATSGLSKKGGRIIAYGNKNEEKKNATLSLPPALAGGAKEVKFWNE